MSHATIANVSKITIARVAALIGGLVVLVLLLGNSIAPTPSHAASSTLLSTSNFAVLAHTTVTNTGSTTISGDLGLSPGLSVTGFPPGLLNGTQHVADAQAGAAQTDLVTVYNNAANATPITTIPTELGGTVVKAGNYASAAGTFAINGTVTLDAQNDPNAVFVFQTGSTLITGGASSVNLINGAQACNVFWQVGSSATLGTNSSFSGNVLALTSITLTTGANVTGRLLARNGAVTLDTNSVTVPGCTIVPPVVSSHSSGGFTNNVPVSNTSIPATTPTVAATTTTTTTVTTVPKLPNTGLAPKGN